MEKCIGAFNEDVSKCWTAKQKKHKRATVVSSRSGLPEWPADAPIHACRSGLWPFSTWPTWHLASAEGYYWGGDFS